MNNKSMKKQLLIMDKLMMNAFCCIKIARKLACATVREKFKSSDPYGEAWN